MKSIIRNTLTGLYVLAGGSLVVLAAGWLLVWHTDIALVILGTPMFLALAWIIGAIVNE